MSCARDMCNVLCSLVTLWLSGVVVWWCVVVWCQVCGVVWCQMCGLMWSGGLVLLCWCSVVVWNHDENAEEGGLTSLKLTHISSSSPVAACNSHKSLRQRQAGLRLPRPSHLRRISKEKLPGEGGEAVVRPELLPSLLSPIPILPPHSPRAPNGLSQHLC